MARFLGYGNGSDGSLALGSYTQTWYSCSGSSGLKTLSVTGTFSAGDRIYIHQSRGTNVGLGEDNQIVSYVSGTATLLFPLERDYSSSGSNKAQVAVVKQASSITGSYNVPDWNGTTGGIFVASCSGLFSGSIDADGAGYNGGAAVAGEATKGRQGEGTSGAGGTQVKTANGNGGGGGGEDGTEGPDDGAGGGGGNGTTGSTGAGTGGEGGTGGATSGSADLSTIVFGGGGGSGSSNALSSGAGGDGGGIVIIYASQISLSSSITADGANGGASGGGSNASGGGGGAGGSILLRSVSSSVGSSIVTADGGSGGGGDKHVGGNGGDGRIRIESCSITGTTSPTASESEGGHNWCGSLTFIM